MKIFLKHILFFVFFFTISIGLTFSYPIHAQEMQEGKIIIQNVSKRGNFYYSEELSLDFGATALGFSWLTGQNDDFEVKFFQDNQWYEWLRVIPGDVQSKNDKNRTFSNLIFTDNAEKIILRSLNQKLLKNVEITYINAAESLPDSQERNVFMTSISRSGNLNIISRAEWGADDSYRFGIVQDKETHEELIAKGAEVRGDQIELWPHEYANVKKFVMHETAGSVSASNPMAIVRGVYYYHAKILGWGDCGYNYILDTLGNIYECRSGGDGVVAGHVYATETITLDSGEKVELGFNMNVGSIGISVLGNYATDTVTGATQNALSQLVEKLALDFQLDPEANGDWDVPIINRSGANDKDFKEAILKSGKLYDIKDIKYEFDVSNMDHPRIVLKDFINFVGHKDIDYKRDPQKNLEQIFTNARKSASQSYQKKMRDGGIIFKATVVAQSATELKLNQGQSSRFWIKVRNDGETAWHNYTDKRIVLSSDSGSYTLNVPNVEPGEVAFIELMLSPNPNRAQETRVFEFSMAGVYEFPKKKIQVVVVNLDLIMADYAAEFQGHNFPPAFFDNAKPTLKLSYLNVGKKTWKKGELILNVVENQKETRPSPWKSEIWKDDFGKFSFLEETVAPQKVATFEIPFTNLSPGKFKHRFYITRPIERDGIILGEEKVMGSGIEIQSRVDPILGAKLILQNIPPAVLMGWNVPVQFTFKNVGFSPWNGTLKLVNLYKPEDVSVSFIDYSWISSDIIAWHSVSLENGKEMTFSFKIDAPRKPGLYDFSYKLMIADQDIWIDGAIEHSIPVRVD